MGKSIFLHIGTQRTGTTVLQKHAFHKIEKHLVFSKNAYESSVTMPPTHSLRANCYEDRSKILTSILIPNAIKSASNKPDDSINKLNTALEVILKNHGKNSILISSETLSKHMHL